MPQLRKPKPIDKTVGANYVSFFKPSPLPFCYLNEPRKEQIENLLFTENCYYFIFTEQHKRRFLTEETFKKLQTKIRLQKSLNLSTPLNSAVFVCDKLKSPFELSIRKSYNIFQAGIDVLFQVIEQSAEFNLNILGEFYNNLFVVGVGLLFYGLYCCATRKNAGGSLKQHSKFILQELMILTGYLTGYYGFSYLFLVLQLSTGPFGLFLGLVVGYITALFAVGVEFYNSKNDPQFLNKDHSINWTKMTLRLMKKFLKGFATGFLPYPVDRLCTVFMQHCVSKVMLPVVISISTSILMLLVFMVDAIRKKWKQHTLQSMFFAPHPVQRESIKAPNNAYGLTHS